MSSEPDDGRGNTLSVQVDNRSVRPAPSLRLEAALVSEMRFSGKLVYVSRAPLFGDSMLVIQRL